MIYWYPQHNEIQSRFADTLKSLYIPLIDSEINYFYMFWICFWYLITFLLIHWFYLFRNFIDRDVCVRNGNNIFGTDLSSRFCRWKMFLISDSMRGQSRLSSRLDCFSAKVIFDLITNQYQREKCWTKKSEICTKKSGKSFENLRSNHESR